MKKLLTVLALVCCLQSKAQDEAAPPPTPLPAAKTINEPSAAPPAPEAPPASDSSGTPAASANPIIEGLGQAIPQAYSADRYSGTWGKNPFLIEVAKPTVNAVSFAQDWALTGLTARPNGEAVAYIRNKQTQDFKRVKKEPDADGFQLVSANPNPDRKIASVEIAKGSETATLKYDETAAAPANPGVSRIPVPGQPLVPGGQPVPGQPNRPGAPAPGNRRPVLPNQGQAIMGVPGQPHPGQPGVAHPGGVPLPNAVPRNPVSRRRILIPPAADADPNAQTNGQLQTQP